MYGCTRCMKKFMIVIPFPGLTQECLDHSSLNINHLCLITCMWHCFVSAHAQKRVTCTAVTTPMRHDMQPWLPILHHCVCWSIKAEDQGYSLLELCSLLRYPKILRGTNLASWDSRQVASIKLVASVPANDRINSEPSLAYTVSWRYLACCTL